MSSTELARWTIHGLRHTIATHLRADLGVSTEVISLILGHTPPGPRVTRIYNRADLLPERAAALAAWAGWIENAASREAPMRRKSRGPRAMHSKEGGTSNCLRNFESGTTS